MASQLAPGFLVAAPSLLDPNFRRSVVLLVDHGPKGSLGFVVNRPVDVPPGAMLDRIGLAPATGGRTSLAVLAGGPMNPITGWVLFEREPMATPSEEVVCVSDRVAVSGSRELLETLLAGKGNGRILLVFGYAGWGEGQLDAEIAQGAWIPVDFDARIVFDTPYQERWSSALRILGIDPARLSLQAPSES